jgi:hypothetical protein
MKELADLVAEYTPEQREYWIRQILLKHPEATRAEAEASYDRWQSRFRRQEKR